MRSSLSRRALVSVLLFAAACSGGAENASDAETEPVEQEAAAPAATGTVTIVEPAEGAEVQGPAVTVRLDTNVEILPAGEVVPGTGHHHLFLDTDVSEAGAPVPTVPGAVVHMGDGSSEYVFEDVAPGEHRLIAVVADGLHVPLQPWVVDTVTFTVR